MFEADTAWVPGIDAAVEWLQQDRLFRLEFLEKACPQLERTLKLHEISMSHPDPSCQLQCREMVLELVEVIQDAVDAIKEIDSALEPSAEMYQA